MFEFLWGLDVQLLYLLNVKLAHPYLDQFWRFITQLHKQPLFLALVIPLVAGWLLYIYRAQVWKLVLILTVAVALADTIAYRLIKSLVFRLRPFQNPEISDWVRQVGIAHGSSFPSNHAANMFAGAMILAWFFPAKAKYFYILAGLVAVSRVALGVHYPSDAIAGSLLGVFVGFFVRSFLLNQTDVFHMRKAISFQSDLSSSWRTRSRRMKQR